MRVEPIDCLRPRPEKVGEFTSLPYDVFTEGEARAYAAAHPTSFLAIDRPETNFPAGQDPYAPEVYEKAHQLLLDRQRDFTLLREERPCLFLYELTEASGHSQCGLVASCAIDDYLDGTIRRHEATRAEKEDDRVRHIKATGAQTGPIFLTYRDNYALDVILGLARSGEPLYDWTDELGVRQRVWRIARDAAIEAICATFATIDAAYVADGHHRLAAAARVCQDWRERDGASPDGSLRPYETFLAVLFPASQLRVLPYNRVVTDTGALSFEEFTRRVEEAGFSWSRPQAEPCTPTEHGTFGVFAKGAWYRLRWQGATTDDPYGQLDTALLHRTIVEGILGITDPRTDPRLSFHGGLEDPRALEPVAGAHGVAFVLYPTSVEELMAVADDGKLMPPKSTWFEPKLRSGLFIRRIDQARRQR